MHRHGQLCIEIFNDPIFAENGLLLWRDGHADAWVVDPGFSPQPDQIASALEKHRLCARAIVLTHCHVDHIAGIEPLRGLIGERPVICPRDEVALLTSAEANLSEEMGLPVCCAPPERIVEPGDTLELSGLSWTARDAAGHSPGGLCYYCEAVGVALVGDAVFAEGLGRYDFAHSSRERLLRNIREQILTLPEDVVVYPGHGPTATVAHLRDRNQYLRWELSQ